MKPSWSTWTIWKTSIWQRGLWRTSVGLLNLLPFSLGELQSAGHPLGSLDNLLWRGLYPPLYDRDLAPGDWHAAYVSTFVAGFSWSA